jgi:hypothetical protein
MSLPFGLAIGNLVILHKSSAVSYNSTAEALCGIPEPGAIVNYLTENL